MTRRVLVRNPESGDREAGERAVAMARERGYEIRTTEEAGDEVRMAREAATDGADAVVACGGDGTVNGVVRGVLGAGRLDEVALGVVPAGTGNDFAENVGVADVEAGLDAVDAGETRRIDLGIVEAPGAGADESAAAAGGDATRRPFLNSCVGGLTAEAGARPESSLKQRMGVLAYVLTTLQHTRSFEGLELTVRAGEERDPVWSGEAVLLVVGNARNLPGQPANVEDGELDVVVVERAPATDFLAAGAVDRVFGGETPYLSRFRTPSLVVEAGRPRQFSLDGELLKRRRIAATTLERSVTFAVGEGYEPPPDWHPSGGDGPD
ncbi:hypothetical protein BRC97_12755 [Halobacteriales archaeon QS_6_71_20]|nr:MAG: hypothetical protein BRC97_12755 [Halobacteriales archaeon QS_6_71_20]